MIAIKAEIDQVAAGAWPADDNPLVNAPHTASVVGGDGWDRPYPRSLAGWPGTARDAARAAGAPRSESEWKYWPPVGRIDGGFGDRNLVCSCPPIDALAD